MQPIEFNRSFKNTLQRAESIHSKTPYKYMVCNGIANFLEDWRISRSLIRNFWDFKVLE